MELERIQQVICQALGFLHNEYKAHVQLSDAFPPEISPSHIRESDFRC